MQHRISIDDLLPLLCGIGFLQQRSNFRKQDCCVIGLRDKSVSTQHDAIQLVHIRVAACHKDDWHFGKCANLGAERKATGPRQFDVQQNQVWLFGFDPINHIRKIFRSRRFIAIALQQRFQFIPYQRIIFYYQYFFFHISLREKIIFYDIVAHAPIDICIRRI